MKQTRLRAIVAALALSFGSTQAAPEAEPAHPASAPAAPSASARVQFPEIPLRRDAAAGESGASIAWAVLFLAVVAGAGFVLVRRGGVAGLRPGAGWPRCGTSSAGRPVSLGRTALTQQASVHVIEWKGEELLLGCTSHSVTLLARAPAAPAALGKTSDGAGAGT
jgi:hypothetical protein